MAVAIDDRFNHFEMQEFLPRIYGLQYSETLS